MQVTTQITGLDVKRIAGAPIDYRRPLEFPMDLYIDAIRRDRDDTAQVVYTFKAASDPELVSFTVSGVLSVEGDPTDVADAITPKGNDPPTIWHRIYQESAQVLAMLAAVINVPFPTPDVEVAAV